MKRGEVWWVDLAPTRGSEIRKRRPAVIITVDALNKARRTVVVVPLSSSATPRPPIVVAVPSAGPDSTVVCDQLRAVDKSRLDCKAGDMSAADLKAIMDGLRIILGMP